MDFDKLIAYMRLADCFMPTEVSNYKSIFDICTDFSILSSLRANAVLRSMTLMIQLVTMEQTIIIARKNDNSKHRRVAKPLCFAIAINSTRRQNVNCDSIWLIWYLRT